MEHSPGWREQKQRKTDMATPHMQRHHDMICNYTYYDEEFWNDTGQTWVRIQKENRVRARVTCTIQYKINFITDTTDCGDTKQIHAI